MKLYTKMGDNTKQVRVDNWGIFFLQRLQMFFSKTDYCDMTLQFEGNVQLKVHRLVMNACTEYFQFLEQTCTIEENVIMMPSDLQADVIVPIVNFMYTGMLEFQFPIFDRLYKTAQIMNITILTKLLDAQKQSVTPAVKTMKKKHESPHAFTSTPVKKPTPKPSHHVDLPAPLPGRKLPVWKRKSVPTPPQPHTHGVSQLCYPEPKWTPPVDPLSIPDNTPKPTRFEWPDDDLPPLNLMDTSFEDISYTSKPLLTQEEEQRATTSFDDLKHIPNANRAVTSSKKRSSPSLDMEEMKNYVKEQKIRSGLSQDDGGVDDLHVGEKRKATEQKCKAVVKKVRFDEQENKTTTISIATDAKPGEELDHEKIVTEILKKYPHLVKKNKNIRLKIMAKNNKPTALEPTKVENIQIRPPRLKIQSSEIQKPEPPKIHRPQIQQEPKTENKAPWRCDRCSTEEDSMEFVLYYLYRKHMTEVHNEKFDPKLCKYCGHRCNKNNLLMFHLYTKHGIKPPSGYNFPKCDQCPFIALSASRLTKHKLRHGKNEIQCTECNLAFTSQVTLTSHIQITGHTGKSKKNNFDCQYCTKRYQSGVNLFSHVKLQHKNEAVRDGIVSVDELDDVEDFEEEESSKDEYILPEIITDQEPPKKVNILSNVKVQDRQEHHPRHQPLSLEPSSEAEALNNVATGIATSLGLVDIVVLNDNQQIFLQSNQQNFSNEQNEQPEFILPELTGRETYVQNQNEVITTDGVITQSMLSSGDIASTDELVMVLTDHDYGDNQEEINNDNSNIVVLYSHPVDGQQDQFITSQGNIMVNSQGLIEIRNGATITSTANQVVMNPQETHIESIEMIQREIESHVELKQESVYEEESKPEVQNIQQDQNETQIKEPQPVETACSGPIIESLTQGEQVKFTSPLAPIEEPEPSELSSSNNEQTTEELPLVECESDQNKESSTVSEEETKEPEDEPVVSEPMEVEANPIETEMEMNPTEEIISQNEELAQALEETEEIVESEEGAERSISEEHTHEETEMVQEKEAEAVPAEETEPIPSQDHEPEPTASEKLDPVPNDPNHESPVPQENEEEKGEQEEGEKEGENPPMLPNEPPEETEPSEAPTDENSKTDMMEIDEERVEESCFEKDQNEECPFEKNQDECNLEKIQEETEATEQELLSQSDTSTSQFNDENSQSSQDSQKGHSRETIATKISILDDWEDTDSQNSDQKEKAKVAGETVHKLMDDWEEEDEEDGRKEAEG